ncbi:MAG TPA: ABC transporter ATP-binding protein [Candidatus Polarisedimenticolia bacterium]|nr:ABC transporter ATP-binding protein [Candidatus Polarisedimenticolia bacterium]
MSPAGGPVRPWALAREYFLQFKGRYAWGFLLLAATNALALSVPLLLKHAVDSLQAADRRRVALFSAAIVAVALGQAAIRTWSRLAILGASRHVAFHLRGRLFSHLQRLPLTWYARRPIGDISSRAVNDMLLVRSFFGPGMMNLVNTTLVYVTAVSMMLAMDARLTLIALAPYPVFLLAVNRLSRRIYAHTMQVQEQLGALTSKAQENISGINLIKTYAREKEESEAWSALSRSYLGRVLALARARGAMVPLMGSMASAGTLVVIGLGGREVILGRITLGDFVAFNAYLAFLVWPTFAFGWILNTFQRGAAALRRIGEVLAHPAEQREPAPGRTDAPLAGAIEFRDLTFSHEGAPAGVRHLDRVNLRVPAGGSLGIVGTVGAGKTTLVNMLPRILPPPPGTVFVDGQDVATLPLSRLRRDIGMVPQEGFLFSRSLRDNVALSGRAGAAALDQAVREARLDKDLPLFPQGLDTVVGERGYTLSGGQRQRATLARALAASPAVLILDDALSSLDAQVEREVVEALRRRKGSSTMIVVSNRVATLSWADDIAVMDGGTVVERGTHEELLAKGGVYARIARRQSLAERLEEA